jgi:putative tricarboxylic transport membrane protein
MLEAAMEGLTGVLQPEALMFMCLGVLIGSLVGFLPGIGGPSTLAICSPSL